MRVLVLGDAFVDIVAGPLESLPRWGADVEAPTVCQLAGGSALNVAVHLGFLSKDTTAECSFHGLVGNDDFANILRNRLSAAGVLGSMETAADGLGTGVCLVLSGRGERAFITQVDNCRKTVMKSTSKLRQFGYGIKIMINISGGGDGRIVR